MLNALIARWRQGHHTFRYPQGEPPPLPDRFRGAPTVDRVRCAGDCRHCAERCPTTALAPGGEVDLGKCLFCGECQAACPNGAITYTADHRLATDRREDLRRVPGEPARLATGLEERRRKLYGFSLKLRQVSAGGCNACEADSNVLTTLAWDLGRFGIQFVASPRHADGILVTGPVSAQMREALLTTYAAVPEPRVVIAVGACAISGGPFAGHEEVAESLDRLVPVDLYIPGCPPHPLTILDGLLRLLGRAPA